MENTKILMSDKNTRCYNLVNAKKKNNQPQDNIAPPWLLTCNCIGPS